MLPPSLVRTMLTRPLPRHVEQVSRRVLPLPLHFLQLVVSMFFTPKPKFSSLETCLQHEQLHLAERERERVSFLLDN